jgi:hypothetical protein
MALTVFPALSRPRKRIFAFLCVRPANGMGIDGGQDSTKALHTELSENVPEPIENKHGGTKNKELVVNRRRGLLNPCHG